MPRCRLAAVLAILSTLTLYPAAAGAQTGAGCRAPTRPSIGVAIGPSSPYFDLERTALDAAPAASARVRGGTQVSARGDLSIAGPLRLRVEGSTASWNVERLTPGPGPADLPIATAAGRMSARHLIGAIGLRGGRAPACGHVLIGGGLYSLGLGDTTLRRPGMAVVAGVEIPTGRWGRVQVEAQVHVIDTDSRFPVSSTKALAGALLAGWAYDFQD
jgi:hypothetical protein